MKLIVGLGNPGKVYADTRHNIGFMAVKALAKALRTELKKDKYTFSLSGKAQVENNNILLAQPLTFMNLSGAAISSLLRRYKVDIQDLLVICDDLDLELGRLRIRPKGSSGGHRGLDSIIEHLGTQDFVRLRIGIDRPHINMEASDYVLSKFNKKEAQALKDALGKAVECCQVWVKEGPTAAMNIFNKREN